MRSSSATLLARAATGVLARPAGEASVISVTLGRGLATATATTTTTRRRTRKAPARPAEDEPTTSFGENLDERESAEGPVSVVCVRARARAASVRACACPSPQVPSNLSLSLLHSTTGYETVPASAKAPRVRAVFDAVAPAYDRMNDAMSGGLHRLWKDATVAALAPALAGAGVGVSNAGGSGSPRPYRHLDLAGGTGDIARRVADALIAAGADASSPAPPRVTVCDVNEAMMEAGQAAAASGARGWSPATAALVDWTVGDAEALPFPPSTFDTATIAFGLRNVTRPGVALAELARALRPGGAVAILEFSQVPAPPLAALYDAWSFLAIPRLGAAIAGDAAPYQYLVESIRKFPSKRALVGMMEEAGLGGVRVRSFAAGAVALHMGWKV